VRSGGEVSLFYALFPSLTTCTKVMYSGMLIIYKHMPIIPAVVAAHSKAGNWGALATDAAHHESFTIFAANSVINSVSFRTLIFSAHFLQNLEK